MVPTASCASLESDGRGCVGLEGFRVLVRGGAPRFRLNRVVRGREARARGSMVGVHARARMPEDADVGPNVPPSVLPEAAGLTRSRKSQASTLAAGFAEERMDLPIYTEEH